MRLCSECKKDISNMHGRSKTCGPECAKLRMNRLIRIARKKKANNDRPEYDKCIVCHAVFKPRDSVQLTCGDVDCQYIRKTFKGEGKTLAHYTELESSLPVGEMACLCGNTLRVIDGVKCCGICGKTILTIRNHWRSVNLVHLKRLGKYLDEYKKDLGGCTIDDENSLDFSDVGEGPDTPLMPMRKCHDCPEMTYNYRCDKCKAKWRARNGSCGLSGFSDLFAGGYIPQQGSGVTYG